MAKTKVQMPESRKGIWLAEEWAEVEHFYNHVICPVTAYAICTGNLALVEKRSTILMWISKVTAILTCFRTTPYNRIAGKGGVANQLGITRAGLASILDRIGITTADLRQESVTPLGLIRKSWRLGPILHELEELAHTLPTAEHMWREFWPATT